MCSTRCTLGCAMTLSSIARVAREASRYCSLEISGSRVISDLPQRMMGTIIGIMAQIIGIMAQIIGIMAQIIGIMAQIIGIMAPNNPVRLGLGDVRCSRLTLVCLDRTSRMPHSPCYANEHILAIHTLVSERMRWRHFIQQSWYGD